MYRHTKCIQYLFQHQCINFRNTTSVWELPVPIYQYGGYGFPDLRFNMQHNLTYTLNLLIHKLNKHVSCITIALHHTKMFKPFKCIYKHILIVCIACYTACYGKIKISIVWPNTTINMRVFLFINGHYRGKDIMKNWTKFTPVTVECVRSM